ncbi:MAG TPA: hypothetical protein PKD24_05335 [Pyrinomonadaceae bacterium]|nr:hypothetical protein [Pyrinomonadaceae bacterium]HMP64974.1 hypothetical protein [Pyrinomonadaceae bacterium]
MRFIVVDDKDIFLSKINSGLKQIDPAYSIEYDNDADDVGDLTFRGDIYGALEINRPGDGLFDEEIDELKEFLEDAGGERKPEVLQVLSDAKAIIALQVLQQGRASSEETLERIDPLWEWLFANYKGLMQADAEGYYDSQGLIIEVE